MKNYFSKVLIFSILLTSSISASAQSCNINSLGDCIYNSAVTCRSTVAGCLKDQSAGLSIPDVELQATASCCRFTGKSKKKRASECFRKIERGLSTSHRTAGPLRKFVKQSQKAVSALRIAGCSTGSNT